MQKEVKRPNQISIKAILFKCDAVWNHFPLNVYKCDAIISKHNMLFQNFKIPRCYLKFLGRTLIWFGCFVVVYIHVHWYCYWECEYMFILFLLPQNICQLIFLTWPGLLTSFCIFSYFFPFFWLCVILFIELFLKKLWCWNKPIKGNLALKYIF
jgi:hypothetical protein